MLSCTLALLPICPVGFLYTLIRDTCSETSNLQMKHSRPVRRSGLRIRNGHNSSVVLITHSHQGKRPRTQILDSQNDQKLHMDTSMSVRRFSWCFPVRDLGYVTTHQDSLRYLLAPVTSSGLSISGSHGRLKIS